MSEFFDGLAEALFSNFQTAAGTLAETKMQLRQVENEEEKQRLTKRMHQETMWFNKASMLAKMYADEKIQQRHEVELGLKERMQTWREGETTRALALEAERTKNRKAENEAKLLKEQEIKDKAKQETDNRKELLREESINDLVDFGMEEEVATAIVDEHIKGQAAVDEISRARWMQDYYARNPDASETDAISAWHEENRNPTTESELEKMETVAAYREEVIAEYKAGEMDKDEYDFKMKMIDRMAHGAPRGGNTKSEYDKYNEAVDKAVANEQMSEAEGAKLKRDYLMRKAGGETGEDGEFSGADMINRYGPFTDTGKLMTSMWVGSGSNDEKERNLRSLDIYLNGVKNIKDIDSAKAADTARMVSHIIVDKLSKVRKEAVNRFDQSVIFTLNSLPEMWSEYQRLAEKHDMGKLLRIEQGVVTIIGKTVHPDITNFATRLGEFMEVRLRLRTGAVINDQEIANEMARQPNPFVDQDVSEGTFLGLMEFSYNYQRALYKSVVDEKWADFIMSQTQSKTKAEIDALKKRVQRPADVSREEAEDTSSWLDDWINKRRK